MAVSSVRVSDNPPPAAWSLVQPDCFRLYAVEGQTLDQVMEVLRVEKSFHATKRAFKRKFSDWGLRKNLSDFEKQQLALERREALQSGRSVTDMSYRGVPIQWARIDRYVAKRSRPFGDRKELFLRATKAFVLQRISSPRGIVDELQLQACQDFLGQITHGIRLFSEPKWYNEGRKIIDNCCDSLNKFVLTEPFTVWKTMIDIVTLPRWKKHPKLRQISYNFFRQTALTRLPKNSPFRDMLRCLTDIGLFESMIGSAIFVQFDTMKTNEVVRRSCHSNVWEHYVDLGDIIESMITCGQFDAAAQYAQNLFEDVSTPELWQFRFKSLIARIHHFRDDINRAIELCENILAQMHGSPNIRHFTDVEVELYDLLARCYEVTRDKQKEIESRWKAFNACWDGYGSDNPNTIFYHTELERLLIKTDKRDDLVRLKFQYQLKTPTQTPSMTGLEEMTNSNDSTSNEGFASYETPTPGEGCALPRDNEISPTYLVVNGLNPTEPLVYPTGPLSLDHSDYGEAPTYTNTSACTTETFYNSFAWANTQPIANQTYKSNGDQF